MPELRPEDYPGDTPKVDVESQMHYGPSAEYVFRVIGIGAGTVVVVTYPVAAPEMVPWIAALAGAK